jgi:hypothetical protein
MGPQISETLNTNPGRTMRTLLQKIEQAFRFLGGVPKELVFDQT